MTEIDDDAVRQWILDHAYSPDDIVLSSHSVLDDAGLESLADLLDIVYPGWKRLFPVLRW